jgi:hypothetical protein
MKPVNQNGHLATHMRVDHTDSKDKWRQYENHEWMMNWHLTIHRLKDQIAPTYLPQGLSVFIRVPHEHNMDELLKFMEEGIA